jgi:hypothetical protein
MLAEVKKTTIYLDDATDGRLVEMSRWHGRSRAALIREAVERMIVDDDRPPRRPRALGASGHSDTSEQVDELLAQGFGE